MPNVDGLPCYYETVESSITLYMIILCCTVAKMKPNWSCRLCGMFSSRRYSVQRHIKIKHGVEETPIPFVDYLIGSRNGFYPPAPKPSFRPKEKSLHDKMMEEAESVFVRRVAEQCFPPGDPSLLRCCQNG